MLLGEHAQELVLRWIGVLELVDQDVAEAGGVALRDVRMLPEQLDHSDDQIAEVHGAGRLQGALVALVNLLRDPARHVVVGGLHLARQEAGVLPAIDAGGVLAGGAHVHAKLLARPLHLRELVRVVVDGESPVERQRFRLAPQDASAGGMERRHPEPLGVGTDQLRHPVLQLAGRFVGEGDGEDLCGPRLPLAQEVGDAMREHARLAAAGARQDEERAALVPDGGELLRIEHRGERVHGVRVTPKAPSCPAR